MTELVVQNIMTELVVHTLYLVHVLAIKVFSRVFSQNVTQNQDDFIAVRGSLLLAS